MSHFADAYCDAVNETLHQILHSTWCYRQEVYDVDGIATALLITYDGIKDDNREHNGNTTWEQFHARMSQVKADWALVSRDVMARMPEHPEKTMLGWEGRTIYFIKGGANPQYWTPEQAQIDVRTFALCGASMWGSLVEYEVANAEAAIPAGRDRAVDYERLVRVAFAFLFRDHLTNGHPQVRTEPGNEGLEIRDVIFTNSSEGGFWKDLKDKYGCSEIVIDAKNTIEVTRADLRQLYCYLKPALGLWGFIVCRAPQPGKLHNYNRTLFKNFTQTRGALILADDDLRRMLTMAGRGKDASEYLRERMSDFVRGI